MPTPATKRRTENTSKAAAALKLTLRREPFDAIVAGTKKTEYRENKEYWRQRLVGHTYREVHFRNGYSAQAPFMRVECKGIRLVGSVSDSYFAIRLGKILELKHYNRS